MKLSNCWNVNCVILSDSPSKLVKRVSSALISDCELFELLHLESLPLNADETFGEMSFCWKSCCVQNLRYFYRCNFFSHECYNCCQPVLRHLERKTKSCWRGGRRDNRATERLTGGGRDNRAMKTSKEEKGNNYLVKPGKEQTIESKIGKKQTNLCWFAPETTR